MRTATHRSRPLWGAERAVIRVGSEFQATVPACACRRARLGEEADARVGSTVWDPAAVTETEGPSTATTRRPARRACPAPRALRSVADRRSFVVLQSTSSWSSQRPSAIRISSPPTPRSPCCIGTRTSRAPPWPSSSAVRPPPPAPACRLRTAFSLSCRACARRGGGAAGHDAVRPVVGG